MAEQSEFKFPDEVEKEKPSAAEDDLKVEVIDDTPPEDRGRKPLPKDMVEELEKDDLEEYSDKVKKRLSQMKKVWHDERREKERAQREKEEAIRFAVIRENEIRARENEIQQLKRRLGNGERVYLQEVTKAASNDLTSSKERLKQAYEAGDAEKIAEAQEALTEAKFRIKQLENFQPSLQPEELVVQPAQQYPVPQVAQPVSDPKAEAWREKNDWFGKDEEMTALALGLHEKLVRSGVDPRSDDYYDRVNATMRKRFPDYFNEEAAEEKPTQTRQDEKPARNKPANVVAPVTRGTAPRQVRLTPTQVAIAKKLGLSNEQYARELFKLEAN
jgi:hypothetical protein